MLGAKHLACILLDMADRWDNSVDGVHDEQRNDGSAQSAFTAAWGGMVAEGGGDGDWRSDASQIRVDLILATSAAVACLT